MIKAVLNASQLMVVTRDEVVTPTGNRSVIEAVDVDTGDPVLSIRCFFIRCCIGCDVDVLAYITTIGVLPLFLQQLSYRHHFFLVQGSTYSDPKFSF